MDVRFFKHSLVAAFVLAGTTAFSSVPQAGDTVEDGTIYAGNGFAATRADAPDFYTWDNANRYCALLVANGHNDWTLPTRDQLNHLYQNKDTGSFAETFNEESGSLAKWYWSSEEHANASFSSFAWSHNFTEGVGGWDLKDDVARSVRCVRAEPSAP